MKMPFDDNNFKAIHYLTLLGNEKPTQQQVDLMECLIKKVVIEQKLLFDRRLTQTEEVCLLLAATGKTTEQTAKLLNLKRSTIKKYRLYIMRKLGCSSIAQAVFEGIRYGYLLPKMKGRKIKSS